MLQHISGYVDANNKPIKRVDKMCFDNIYIYISNNILKF